MTPDTGRSGKALLHAQLLHRTSNYTAKSELNIQTKKLFGILNFGSLKQLELAKIEKCPKSFFSLDI